MNAVDEFEPVSWGEVRDHLISRLMMDEDWTVDDGTSLSWWPTPLVMHIDVIEEGTYPDSTENWMRVRASTPIVALGEEQGRAIASQHAPSFPVGAVVFADGHLSLQTIFSFNPRNRGLLSWFHQAVLIQAATALSIAATLQESAGLSIPQVPHPVSGIRSGVDDLITIYGGETLGLPVDHDMFGLFQNIRPTLRNMMTGFGYQLGFSGDDVDFFNWGFAGDDPSNPLGQGAFDVGVGFMPGAEHEQRLGPGLVLIARLLPPGVAFDTTQASYANEDLSKMSHASLFGYATGPEAEAMGSTLIGMVPHLTMSEWSKMTSEDFATLVVNAIFHIAATAQMFRREILNIHWPPDPSGQENGESL